MTDSNAENFWLLPKAREVAETKNFISSRWWSWVQMIKTETSKVKYQFD